MNIMNSVKRIFRVSDVINLQGDIEIVILLKHYISAGKNINRSQKKKHGK